MAEDGEELFDVFDDRDDADVNAGEPDIAGAPGRFLRLLRACAPQWRDLDIRPGAVFTGYAGDRL